MLTLKVEKRAQDGRATRKGGAVPGVVYGAHQEATSVAVDARAFDKVFREAGEATIVALEGLGAQLPTLIHEVDLDPLTHRPRHIDFYAVTKGQKVEVAIPLDYIGESPAVKGGANLIKVLHELEVKADPMSLPHDIKVDISALAAIGDQVHVRDLVIPAGVEVMVPEEEVVALIQEVREEKVEEAPADLSTIEDSVEKGKKEEEVAAPEAKAE